MRRRTHGLLAVMLAMGGAVLAAEEQKTGSDSPRYPTPQDCPRFANPEFRSRPLEKTYSGIEFNIRPGVRGGTYPDKFALEKRLYHRAERYLYCIGER